MEIYLIGCAAIFVFLGVQFYFAQKNRKKAFHERIKREWGKVPEREYTDAEFESITHYYRNTIDNSEDSGNRVDDVTWNDLEYECEAGSWNVDNGVYDDVTWATKNIDGDVIAVTNDTTTAPVYATFNYTPATGYEDVTGIIKNAIQLNFFIVDFFICFSPPFLLS